MKRQYAFNPSAEEIRFRRSMNLLLVTLGLVLIVAVPLAGIWITSAIADNQENMYRRQRESQVAAAATGLEHSEIESLKGDMSDLGTPAYENLRRVLLNVKKSDPDIRFAYLMRPQNGKMVFLVDAEDPSSPDFSPPGEVYPDAKPSDFYPYEGRGSVEAKVNGPLKDRWGEWMSASAYIQGEDGIPCAELVTDVAASTAARSWKQIKQMGLLFSLVAAFLLGLVIAQTYRSNRRLLRSYDTLEESVRQRTLELEKAKEALESSNEELDRFAHTVSHDLQQPLFTIYSFTKLLNETQWETLDENGREYTDLIMGGAERMQNFISGLLEYSRLGSGRKETARTDLNVLLDSVIHDMSAVIEESGARITRGKLPTLEVDERQFFSLFQNLLSNALKFRDEAPPEVRVSAEPASGYWLFRVRDNGIGMAEDHLVEIFEVFKRLHGRSEFEGTGIGLSICRTIVENHGGRIWVESVPGSGSTFLFTVPGNRAERDKGG